MKYNNIINIIITALVNNGFWCNLGERINEIQAKRLS